MVNEWVTINSRYNIFIEKMCSDPPQPITPLQAEEDGQNLMTAWRAFQSEAQTTSDFGQLAEVNGNKNPVLLPFGIIHPDASESSQKMDWEPTI